MMHERQSGLAELMDDPGASREELEHALVELAMINRWLGGYRTTRIGVGRLTQHIPSNRTITILDIAAGGTDLTSILRPLNRHFAVTALDINPHMREFGSRHGHHAEVVTASAHSLPYPDRSFDIVHTSLFLHHCTDLQAIRLLRQTARIARMGVVINDLHRHAFALAGITALTALFARSPIVSYDARASVRRAFRRDALEDLLDRAGITDGEISWRWAFRWCIWFPVADGSPSD
jgi:2-polyprenyl-3-methyl-5-hydroxy-6-metoxy-1,4-benzoquinol methylase